MGSLSSVENLNVDLARTSFFTISAVVFCASSSSFCQYATRLQIQSVALSYSLVDLDGKRSISR